MNWHKIVNVMQRFAVVGILFHIVIAPIINAYYPHEFWSYFDRYFRYVMLAFLAVLFGIRRWKIPPEDAPQTQSTELETKTE